MALDAEAKQEQCQKFVIWKELAAGKELLCSWPLCDLYFVNDSLFPGWLVLVPRVPNVREIFELSTEQQVLLIEEISKASKAVRELFCPDKLNVGALGNVVEQLHVHVVPRWRSDKAWPGPMWGAHPAQPFSPEELRKCLGKLHQHLGFEPLKDLETRHSYRHFSAHKIRNTGDLRVADPDRPAVRSKLWNPLRTAGSNAPGNADLVSLNTNILLTLDGPLQASLASASIERNWYPISCRINPCT